MQKFIEAGHASQSPFDFFVDHRMGGIFFFQGFACFYSRLPLLFKFGIGISPAVGEGNSPEGG